MHTFFDPQGIVVIGLSDRPGNLGRRVVENLKRWNYAGRIVGVGRRAGHVDGVVVLTTMDRSERFAGCDLAVVLTPAATVPDFVRQCAAVGIDRIVVQSSGFAEFDREGSALQDELVAAIEQTGVRLVGPNCVGFVQQRTGSVASFAVIAGPPVAGDTAVISQSGGVALGWMRNLHAQGVGVNWLASIGNKLDVDEVHVAEYLLQRHELGRLVCYLESVSRGRALCDWARQARAPVIVHKVNRSPATAEVAISHTAALANDDAVASAAFAQAGILRVADSSELELAVFATHLPPVKGNRVALLSRSGGHAVIATDSCVEAGLQLPAFSAQLCDDLAAIQPQSVIHRRNPLDFGDVFDFERMAQIVERVCREPGFDAIVVVQVFNELWEAVPARAFIERVRQLSHDSAKPIALASVAPEHRLIELRRQCRWPVFSTPEQAVRAVALLHERQQALRRAAGPRYRPARRAEPVAAPPRQTRVWSLLRSLELVASSGIPVASTRPLGSGQDVPYPAVLKYSVDSEQVVHKASLGLVQTNVASGEALARAATAVATAAARAGLAGGETVVQPMVRGEELFIGAKRDPAFGPVVLFGCGGSLVELIDDVALWPYPFTAAEIEHLYERSRLARLVGQKLAGSTLCNWLAGLGAVLESRLEIAEIDVNPLVMSPAGPLAIDARVVMG